MKKILLILLFTCFILKKTNGQNYILVKPILAERSDLKGVVIGTPKLLEETWLIKIIVDSKEYKIITVLPFVQPRSKSASNDTLKIIELNKSVATYVSNTTQNISNFFKISSTEFDDVARKVEERWGFGSIILPLKMRFGDTNRENRNLRYFDFTSEVNVGLSLARRMSSPKSRAIDMYVIGSLNLSSIPLDSATTGGFQKSATKISAISPTLGFLFNFKNSGLQLIATSGLDFISGELGRKWIYSGQPWAGIGIGFSIFKFGNKGEQVPPKSN